MDLRSDLLLQEDADDLSHDDDPDQDQDDHQDSVVALGSLHVGLGAFVLGSRLSGGSGGGLGGGLSLGLGGLNAGAGPRRTGQQSWCWCPTDHR